MSTILGIPDATMDIPKPTTGKLIIVMQSNPTSSVILYKRINFLYYIYVTLFISTAMAANSTTMNSANEFVPTARLTTSKLTKSTAILTSSSNESKPIQEPSKIFEYIVKKFT